MSLKGYFRYPGIRCQIWSSGLHKPTPIQPTKIKTCTTCASAIPNCGVICHHKPPPNLSQTYDLITCQRKKPMTAHVASSEPLPAAPATPPDHSRQVRLVFSRTEPGSPNHRPAHPSQPTWVDGGNAVDGGKVDI